MNSSSRLFPNPFRPLALALAAGFAFISTSLPVFAQGGEGASGTAVGGVAETSSEEDEIARARESFEEGRELMKEERWSAAAQAFRRAASLRRTPGLLYYVGYCEEQAGHFVVARESYLAAGRLAKELPAKDVEGLLPDALRRVEAQLGRLLLGGAPESAQLLVDGETVAVEGELWLAPGEHDMMLSAPGYLPRNFTLRVARGQTERVDLSLRRSGEAQGEPSGRSGERGAEGTRVSDGSRPAYEGSTARKHPAFAPAVFGGGGALLVGLGAGIAGTLVANDSAKKVVEYGQEVDRLGGNCNGASGPLGVACDNLSRAAGNHSTATAIAVAGYVTAGVGATFLVLGLTVWNQDQVRVAAVPLPGGTGLSVSGRF